MKKHIPNCLSIANLISGSIGIVLALRGELIYAAYALFVGAYFDFLDGFVARILRAESAVGKQLDTLADLITFGALPASIMYVLIKTYESCPYRPYAALILMVCTACRLAKFNVDQRQSYQFIGLPTPANALLIATLPMLLTNTAYPCLVKLLTQPLVLPLGSIFMSFLLVSNFRFVSLKFKQYDFSTNKIRYCFIGIWLLLIAYMQVAGVFFGIWLYILHGLLNCKQA